ncbi:hypothetical protein TEQG_05012 [Trichophyton equinum CBS 127.97]|uniref:Uncharacterized protein n=1 Tax=Trichophyton equinum (strain ATCC MYA-4606 / CBS 127.97) TaxID=559882 RepID=F2PVT6_TRIEC|nr:hypothetical protein TEQG_05012 [Trichophyton equinum CBS 127.97]
MHACMQQLGTKYYFQATTSFRGIFPLPGNEVARGLIGSKTGVPDLAKGVRDKSPSKANRIGTERTLAWLSNEPASWLTWGGSGERSASIDYYYFPSYRIVASPSSLSSLVIVTVTVTVTVTVEGCLYIWRLQFALPCSKRTVDVDYIEDWQTGACIGQSKSSCLLPSCLSAPVLSSYPPDSCLLPPPAAAAAAVDKQPPRPRAISRRTIRFIYAGRDMIYQPPSARPTHAPSRLALLLFALGR